MALRQRPITKSGIEDFYSGYAEEYEQIYDDYLSSSQALISAVCDSVPSGSSRVCIVDLGCGTGHQLARIHAGLVKKGFEPDSVLAVGLDITDEMVQVAARRHPELSFEVGSFLDPVLVENLVGHVSTFSPSFVAVTVLGNTVGHVAPDRYADFAACVQKLMSLAKQSISFIEFRDGDRLSQDKPAFELRCNKQFGNEHVLSFYVMEHLTDHYPTDIYVFKLSNQNAGMELHAKRIYTKSGFYVRPKSFEQALSAIGIVTNVPSLKSKLDYGIVWKVERAK